ncbi:hypothetical protein [Providencia sp. Je.9.19]|uniref:hypothetical protein n=1 Tax=unclassified Providencia TaxID=2633465 RepID=UPI003DA90012
MYTSIGHEQCNISTFYYRASITIADNQSNPYPRTTWGHFNSPLNKRFQAPASEEPDFGAM